MVSDTTHKGDMDVSAYRSPFAAHLHSHTLPCADGGTEKQDHNARQPPSLPQPPPVPRTLLHRPHASGRLDINPPRVKHDSLAHKNDLGPVLPIRPRPPQLYQPRLPPHRRSTADCMHHGPPRRQQVVAHHGVDGRAIDAGSHTTDGGLEFGGAQRRGGLVDQVPRQVRGGRGGANHDAVRAGGPHERRLGRVRRRATLLLVTVPRVGAERPAEGGPVPNRRPAVSGHQLKHPPRERRWQPRISPHPRLPPGGDHQQRPRDRPRSPLFTQRWHHHNSPGRRARGTAQRGAGGGKPRRHRRWQAIEPPAHAPRRKDVNGDGLAVGGGVCKRPGPAARTGRRTSARVAMGARVGWCWGGGRRPASDHPRP